VSDGESSVCAPSHKCILDRLVLVVRLLVLVFVLVLVLVFVFVFDERLLLLCG
jgi:hypothetical protein